MADIGAFYKATISEQIKELPDAVIQHSKILKYFKDKGCMKMNRGGQDIKGRVRKSESTIGGATNIWGTGSAQTTQPFEEWTANWRQYLWRLMLNDFQNELNSNASAVAKMFDMAKEQINEVRQSATSRLTTHLYGNGSDQSTGDNGTPLSGLEAVMSTSNTYQGIARSGNTYWQPQIVSCTNPSQDDNSNDLTNLYEKMMELWTACSQGKHPNGNSLSDTVAVDADEPDSIITTATLFRAYWASLEPRQRYSSAQAGPLKSLQFGTAGEVMWDQYCTAARMYFLNARHFEFWCSGSQLITEKKVVEEHSPLTRIHVLGGQMQLICKNPRYQGAIQTTGS